MLAVISNQHLIKRKGGSRKDVKTVHSSPLDYETRNVVPSSDGVSCAEKDEMAKLTAFYEKNGFQQLADNKIIFHF